jgi:hypothetical protein
MKNWKTTMTGILGLIPVALHVFNVYHFTADQMSIIGAFISALGFSQTKDKDVTGAGVTARRVSE